MTDLITLSAVMDNNVIQAVVDTLQKSQDEILNILMQGNAAATVGYKYNNSPH